MIDIVFSFILIIAMVVLYKKNRDLKKKIAKKDSLLIRQAKLASIGEMLEHIAHQWKQPLAQINSISLNIESSFEDGVLNKNLLENELSQIENQTLYMSETIESFKSYLHPDKEKTLFSMKEVIDETLLLIKPLLKHQKIECFINIKNDRIVKGYKKEFIQTLLVLLNNAKDALLENKVKNPHINIQVDVKNNKTIVLIKDNGRGIDEQIIDKIFDPYFTTKKESQGTGHGLSMAKMIVEESFGGRLNAINEKDGACFRIEF